MADYHSIHSGADIDSAITTIKSIQSGITNDGDLIVSSGSTKDLRINFPKPYPDGVVPVVMVQFLTGSVAGTFGRCVCAVLWDNASQVPIVDNTGFTVRVYNGDSAARNPHVQWFAIT